MHFKENNSKLYNDNILQIWYLCVKLAAAPKYVAYPGLQNLSKLEPLNYIINNLLFNIITGWIDSSDIIIDNNTWSIARQNKRHVLHLQFKRCVEKYTNNFNLLLTKSLLTYSVHQFHCTKKLKNKMITWSCCDK